MALLLLALLPLALPWGLVCFGGLVVILFTWAFSCVGLPRMGGLLAALPEVRLPGMGCWCPFRVPQILCLTPVLGVRSWLLVSGMAVRTLLLATSLPLGMDVSLAPGRCLSVSTFYRLYLYPFGSCSEVPGPPVLLSSYAALVISSGTGFLSSLSPFQGCLSGSSELGWGSVGLLRTSDVRVFFSECTLRPGLGLD